MISSSVDISIIIINYNTFQLTCNCIRSIKEKTIGCTFEIILVDNASTETDPDNFLKMFPEITLVKSESNMGFAKGNNAGIAHAQGEFILLLNSDTELKNDAISICKKFLVKHPSVGVVSARLEYDDGRVQNNCQRFPAAKYKMFELLRLQKLLPKRLGGKVLLGFFFDHRQVVYPDWVWGTFFMFRKQQLQLLPQQKLADEFFMYVEDMQWCMEFMKLGYLVAFEPAAEVIHHMGKSGGARSSLMEKNMAIFMNRYYSSFSRVIIRILDKLLG
ncbi:MAG: glycosyltransferase family 2 protein [Bacteroidota bacterium]